MTIYKRNLVVVFSVVFVLIATAILPLAILFIANSGQPVYEPLVLGEIYHQNTNVQQLFNILAGKDQTNLAEITALAQQTMNAADFRAQNYGKKSGQDLQVTFGGARWHVCYLSTDKLGNPILTLWLAEFLMDDAPWCAPDYQIAAEEYDENFLPDFPRNMYGTSYVRAVALNNGGQYAIAGDTLSAAYQPTASSPFAKFTMPDVAGAVTEVIVKPSQVAWQENEQFAKLIDGVNRFNCSNENWGVVSDAGFFENFNYALKSGNDTWKNDYLWLPSLTEAGYNYAKDCLWKLNNEQRALDSKTWTRTAQEDDNWQVRYYANMSAQIMATDWAYGAFYGDAQGASGVRPALHINLNLICE